MEKEIRKFKVDYSLEWMGVIEIIKIRQDLDEIEKLGATHVEIASDIEYDSPYTIIEAVSERIETDEECLERVQMRNQREEEIQQRELDQLEKLKLKYNK